MSMISGLYDYFVQNPVVTHGTMFAIALVVLIAASSSIITVLMPIILLVFVAE